LDFPQSLHSGPPGRLNRSTFPPPPFLFYWRLYSCSSGNSNSPAFLCPPPDSLFNPLAIYMSWSSPPSPSLRSGALRACLGFFFLVQIFDSVPRGTFFKWTRSVFFGGFGSVGSISPPNRPTFLQSFSTDIRFLRRVVAFPAWSPFSFPILHLFNRF